MNKKRFFGALLIIMALIVMLLPAAEADAETSASAFRIKSGELVEYTGTEKTVSVPKTVTSIGASAFENNIVVEKIILPDSVKQIDAYAFWGCENLKTVTLGKGLSEIGDFAFTNCDGLETMTIPSNVRSIGIQAFAYCDRFENITIPPEVTNIREDAFDGDYLLNIQCETGSYADTYAQDFYERQKNMTVYDTSGSSDGNPDKPLNTPEDGVYSGADIQDGREDNIPDKAAGEVLGSTKVVGNQAVVLMQGSELSVRGGGKSGGTADDNSNAGNAGAAGGENTVPEEDGAASEEPWKISERSHYRDENFTQTTLAEGVREIGRFAYARSGLTGIVLPEGLESIDYAAFYHCDNLTSVELPESVTNVAAKAFAHTAWVDNFLNGNAEDGGLNGGGSTGEGEQGDFLISGGVLVAYRGDAEGVTVPEGVRVIAGEAFADHPEMRRISIPDSVEYIDDDAFLGCVLEEIEYGGFTFSEDTMREFADEFAELFAGESAEEFFETNINFGAMDAAPQATERSFPFTWIIAALLLAGGCVCVFQRAGS